MMGVHRELACRRESTTTRGFFHPGGVNGRDDTKLFAGSPLLGDDRPWFRIGRNPELPGWLRKIKERKMLADKPWQAYEEETPRFSLSGRHRAGVGRGPGRLFHFVDGRAPSQERLRFPDEQQDPGGWAPERSAPADVRLSVCPAGPRSLRS
jgi:hypothetical protein